MFVLYSFGHCIVCPSSIYGFEYLWYLQTLRLYLCVILQKTEEDFFFLIWSFICVIFVDQVCNCFIHVPSKVKVNLCLPSSYISNSQLHLFSSNIRSNLYIYVQFFNNIKRRKKTPKVNYFIVLM